MLNILYYIVWYPIGFLLFLSVLLYSCFYWIYGIIMRIDKKEKNNE